MIPIRVRDLGKQYRIGRSQGPYRTLRESLTDLLSFRRSKNGHGTDEIWAMQGVDFDVDAGEVVGVIGRNGAGKSTLLKILARITEPTTGFAEIRGRVGSLLEVGTGFHLELTGRENIFLNGAILGMKRSEIQRKFDDIVEFAEVARFIDTPVKHYSSGMHLRLAFAVAAHLEPEILLMDEVLAVGDASFQKKCLNKMGAVAQAGRTVLFVSHSMPAIRELCTRAIWIDSGRVQSDGDVYQVTETYLRSVASRQFSYHNREYGFTIERVALANAAGEESLQFAPGDDIVVEIWYEAAAPVEHPYFVLLVEGVSSRCFSANMLLDGSTPRVLEGKGCLRCRFRRVPLLPQSYSVNLSIRGGDGRHHIMKPQDVALFTVTGRLEEYGFKGEFYTMAARGTSVVVPYEWILPGGETVPIELKRPD